MTAEPNCPALGVMVSERDEPKPVTISAFGAARIVLSILVLIVTVPGLASVIVKGIMAGVFAGVLTGEIALILGPKLAPPTVIRKLMDVFCPIAFVPIIVICVVPLCPVVGVMVSWREELPCAIRILLSEIKL